MEALRWLSSPEAAILALVDLNLPKMGSYEIIRLLKANPAFAQTIFVILPRRDGILDRLKGRLAVAHAYLTKPFKIDQLVAVILASLGDTVHSPGGYEAGRVRDGLLGKHDTLSRASRTLPDSLAWDVSEH